ncbi:restriction endonuclease [Paraburkholderia sediminicola]|uniref:nSTAND3 domain-containing NTPase n=1 Tax=Paraburkholderia sediminicola TaxID=458836 RepID=UPI0038BE0CCF
MDTDDDCARASIDASVNASTVCCHCTGALTSERIRDVSQYDFKTLNDKEFESLCTDLLGAVIGKRFERFKSGRDAGVDGRFFMTDRQEGILQCKHWANTPVRELVRRLASVEKPKLDRLKPKRYMLAVSNPLSRLDKTLLSQAVAPYLAEDDIFGLEDLNDFLNRHPEIEKRHYKLWLNSTYVLDHIFNHAIHGRSDFSLSEIVASTARYAVTSNHEAALRTLDKLGVVIITGEPGVGKTTLANHLCLHYVARGFDYVKIGDDIRDAESVFRENKEQVFYFDDFLGRNYLEALKGHEGTQIAQFIRRVSKSDDKKFILTSRSTILNQGKFLIDNYQHNNLQKNEYELKISGLSEMDRAQILYNHIWHSELSKDFIERLYENKRYKEIIAHRHYNSRLIDYITDAGRLDGITATDYWAYVRRSLDNPSQIWENPFLVQQDDFGRALIILTAFSGRQITEHALGEAYARFIALTENQGFKGRREFQSNVRMLTGSFFNRLVTPGSPAQIDLFNPSIGDFVLQRYASDLNFLRMIIYSLRSYSSLTMLRSLKSSKKISETGFNSILKFVANRALQDHFSDFTVFYITCLCDELRDCADEAGVIALKSAAVRFVVESTEGPVTDDSFKLIEWGLRESKINANEALEFVESHAEDATESYELHALGDLLKAIDSNTAGYHDVYRAAHDQFLSVFSERFDEFIDVPEALSGVGPEEYSSAKKELRERLESNLADYGIEFDDADVESILDSFDHWKALNEYHSGTSSDDLDRSSVPTPMRFDAVDDLFERD